MKTRISVIVAACALCSAVALFAQDAPVQQPYAAPGAPVQDPYAAPTPTPTPRPTPVPVPEPYAAPGAPVQTTQQKDECLLYSKNCMGMAMSLQEKMKRIDNEIRKGTRVYSPQELKRLQEKLKDANDTLDVLEKGSGE